MGTVSICAPHFEELLQAGGAACAKALGWEAAGDQGREEVEKSAGLCWATGGIRVSGADSSVLVEKGKLSQLLPRG